MTVSGSTVIRSCFSACIFSGNMIREQDPAKAIRTRDSRRPDVLKSGTTASLCDYAVALPNTGRRGRFGGCGPSGRLLFDVLSLVHELLIDGVYDQVAQNAEEDAENQRNQNVGRVVDVQVQP